MRIRPAIVAALALVGCNSSSAHDTPQQAGEGHAVTRLPTGATLDPVALGHDVGPLPLAAVWSPDTTRLVVSLDGWRQQGVQVIDRHSGNVVETLEQPAAFIGLAFSPDGNTLYASGGNEDQIYVYAWRGDSATLTDSIVLEPKPDTAKLHAAATRAGQQWKDPGGSRYPAGLGLSPDGKLLYVAENLGDSLAIVDLGTQHVRRRVATGKYPYGVVVDKDGTVFVSAWGGHIITALSAGGQVKRIDVARHPSAMLLNGNDLYVVSASTDRIDVVDTKTLQVTKHIDDPAPGVGEGSTPNGVAVAADGSRLFVAEADNNAVAVVDLKTDSVAGRIPVEWYPTVVMALPGDTLYVVNGKGHGTAPNPTSGPGPNRPSPHAKNGNPYGYTLGQLDGTLTIFAAPPSAALAEYSTRVASANGWDKTPTASTYPPIEHVLYIIKENRTYDQLFGDLTQADGDTSIVFFGRDVTPNHHALAERFGIWDRFFVNAEVSADGHIWSTGAYAPDYVEKTVQSNYSGRGRTYDYEGTNRNLVPKDGDDVSAPAAGYIWDLVAAKHLTLRDYGEFVAENGRTAEEGHFHGQAEGDKAALAKNTNPQFPPFDLTIEDQKRADIWISELQKYVKQGSMPAFEIMHLGDDHTAGATPGMHTPRAMVADNDYALGRIAEALSKSPFWKTSAIFVLEDDAQAGADHVDSHRSPMLVISPYSRAGVIHRFANTTDVIATIEGLLHLSSMSQFDRYGRPLREAFAAATPDTTPFTALQPTISLSDTNPAKGPLAALSRHLRLAKEDESDETLFNTVLWRAIKGPNVPEPPPRRASMLELMGMHGGPVR
jgi:YVTN family beta-propeller protein